MRAIVAEGVTKSFNGFTALDDVSLTVSEGEIVGLLGPNGAGKSTLVSALAGLSRVDSGSIEVLGLDPARHGPELRERVGVQLQTSQLPQYIKVGEAMHLYASFYKSSTEPDDLLRDWGLMGKKDANFDSLSGGQRQRLFICLALVNNPELVILDELTTGLDPAARRASWELIEQIRDRGVTVLLVTHFMEEAQRLCDRVALMHQGKIVRVGTPDELTSRQDQLLRLSFTQPKGLDLGVLEALETVSRVSVGGGKVIVEGGGYLMVSVASALAQQESNPHDLAMESLSLDDLFIELAGTEGATIA